MNDEQFCLKWNNYNSNIQSVLSSLLAKENLVDVTLTCDGKKIKCHRVVLSAASPYFEDLFSDEKATSPSIIFLKGVKFDDLEAIVQFMYCGEVNVHQEQLASLLKVAEELKVRGLADEEENPPASKPELNESSDNITNNSSSRKRRRISGSSAHGHSDDILKPLTENTSESPVPIKSDAACSDVKDSSNDKNISNSSPSTVPAQSVPQSNSSVSIKVAGTSNAEDTTIDKNVCIQCPILYKIFLPTSYIQL